MRLKHVARTSVQQIFGTFSSLPPYAALPSWDPRLDQSFKRRNKIGTYHLIVIIILITLLLVKFILFFFILVLILVNLIIWMRTMIMAVIMLRRLLHLRLTQGW